jgi:hypothetical protein
VQQVHTHTACTRSADDSVNRATVQFHNTGGITPAALQQAAEPLCRWNRAAAVRTMPDGITPAALQQAAEPLCRWNRAATVRTMLFGTTTLVSTVRPVMGEVLMSVNHRWMLLRS